ncbi:MAG: hypothetical protein RL701_614 [Pseudomonadota bacterium]
MKKFVDVGAWCACLGLLAAGCATQQADSGEPDIEEAVSVAALQQGQDGSDEDFADATDAAPVMDRECKFSDIRKHVVATYDVNHDGELDTDERAELREDFGGAWRKPARRHAAREARRSLLRKIYDTDGSQVLEADERAELAADLDARCEQRMAKLTAKFDADGDGSLDEAEWTAARNELALRYQKARKALLERFDSDRDGKLDVSERAAALSALHDGVEARWEALAADFDSDGDGKLDDVEKDALRAALKAKVRGEAASS